MKNRYKVLTMLLCLFAYIFLVPVVFYEGDYLPSLALWIKPGFIILVTFIVSCAWVAKSIESEIANRVK